MFGYDTDEERVERVMKGEPLSPRWQCAWGIHVWERWTPDTPYTGKFERNSYGNRYVQVHRYCKFCSKFQFKLFKG